MYLFFDTETTGLPRDWSAPARDVNNWPRLVQIAWLHYDQYDRLTSSSVHIIKPDGFHVPRDASKIHRITTERAMREGIPLVDALMSFSESAHQSRLLVAHNISYDANVVQAEFIREELNNPFSKLTTCCTMREATDFCKLSGPQGYKWPKLSELHRKLFHEGFEEAHDALADVKACAKCFFELKRRSVIRVPE